VGREVALEEIWRRVFTTSRGWKRMVEQVPLRDPARKAFTMGLVPDKMSDADMMILMY